MNDPAPSAATFNPGTRKYPDVPCPQGHSTFAKNYNKRRYCPNCRRGYAVVNGVCVVVREPESDYGNAAWRALRWDNGADNLEWRGETYKRDCHILTKEARRQLLAEIELFEKENRLWRER